MQIEKTGILIPEETLAWFGNDELRARVFIEKYALRDSKNKWHEKIPPEMWKRVALEIAGVEKDEIREKWENEFYWLLEDFRFVPGGRIMFGAGTRKFGIRATVLNCYYLPIEFYDKEGVKQEDSLNAIFECARKMAVTYSYGGGVGINISSLRPRGATVKNSARFSTGAVSFMQTFSNVTGTIGQAGRRGALMIVLGCWHPDIYFDKNDIERFKNYGERPAEDLTGIIDFLDIKNDPRHENVMHANISVLVTDDFMRAVENDADWQVSHEFKSGEDILCEKRTYKARDIWNKIIKSAWASAEPGVIFWDTVKRESPSEYNPLMAVKGFNPCSEQALEDYGCCCLGNINLEKFVLNSFTANAKMDYVSLKRACYNATRFLDDVLDYNADQHPLEEQKTASLNSRRIGVGFTGFGDMLAKLGKKYDTEEAIIFTDELFRLIKLWVYGASVDLAKEKGAFPLFDAKEHLKRQFIERLEDEMLKSDIQTYGLRNACILTVPPVGSGSVLAGTSNGIEPIFALAYTRRSKSLSKEEFVVYHPSVKNYLDNFARISEEEKTKIEFLLLQDDPQDKVKAVETLKDRLPNYFVTAHEINPEKRVEIQAAIQKHIDSCISSTINFASDIKPGEIDKVYKTAWKKGVKSVSVYREGSREGILETFGKAEKEEGIKPRKRPKILKGETQGVKTPFGKMYITVNFHPEDGNPFEVFIQIGKCGQDMLADAEAIGRLVSLSLRSGINIKEVVDQLVGIGGANQIWDEGKRVSSVADAIANVLSSYISSSENEKPGVSVKIFNPLCPRCRLSALKMEGGCPTCGECGWTKCE